MRAVGVSCHGLEPLAAATDCDWIDVQLVRINPFGQKMVEDGKPDEVAAQMKQMRAKGRGVIGMKIFGENGFDSAEKRLESLKYVLGLGCVQAFTIGFVSPQQIDETLSMIEKASSLNAERPPTDTSPLSLVDLGIAARGARSRGTASSYTTLVKW